MKLDVKIDLECAYCKAINKNIIYTDEKCNLFTCKQCGELNEVVKDFIAKKTLRFLCNKCNYHKEYHKKVSIEGKNYCLDCWQEAIWEFNSLMNDDPDFKEQWEDGFDEWFKEVWNIN